MIEKHLLKLLARDDIAAEEEQALRALVSESGHVPAHRALTRAGEELDHCTLLLEGWAARVKDLAGGQRQIAELNVAGDFTDLHGFTLKRLDHDVVTVTPCWIAIVPHDRLLELTERHPHLTRVYWFATNLDAAIHREWTLSLGRRDALARTAHLFCEMFVRLRIVGLTGAGGYDFPLTQVELGECLGLTSVHVNRTLQELRRRGLIELRARRLAILDWKGLQQAAEFDDSYLYLQKRER